MTSIDLDGIDEATSRGVAELKKELAEKMAAGPDWPDTIVAGGRRSGKSGMMAEAIKRMTGHSVEIPKPPVDSKTQLNWDLRTSKIYQRPKWAGPFHGASFDGVLEFLIPDTVMGKPVASIEVKREYGHSVLGIEVELKCHDIEVQTIYINSDGDPRLMLIGFSEYRDVPPLSRLFGDKY